MKWIILAAAGGLEVEWAVAMKYSEGFTRPLPTILTIIGYIASAVFLSIARRHLPLRTAYALWTGIGILGTTILGTLLFRESLSLPQVICVLMILAGIAGLRIMSK